MKPSKLFEGENSSLRKTFNSVSMTKEEEIREEFYRYIEENAIKDKFVYKDQIADFWLQKLSEAIAEEREQYKPLMIEGGKDGYLFVKIPDTKGDFSLFYKPHLTQE